LHIFLYDIQKLNISRGLIHKTVEALV